MLLSMAPSTVLLVMGPRLDASASSAALRILATALSILTGFLLAVIMMTGDPDGLYPGSWRIASGHRRQIMRVLTRYTTLFYIYLSTILATFLAALLGGWLPDHLHRWVTHAALCLGLTALLWSFGLPIAIRRERRRRLDEEVDKRRFADR